MQSRRCYTCNDRGHMENRCPNNAKVKPTGFHVRYAQPVFELTIKGLQRVLVCDREQIEYEVRSFGLEVTFDALRIVHQGDKISFFGTPSRDREFALILANTDREIRIKWGERRLIIGAQYILTDDSIRTDLSPSTQAAPEIDFAVSCEGETVYGVGIDFYFGDRVDKYEIYIDGRRQLVVVPLFVADHLKLWMRNKERRAEADRADVVARGIESVVAEIVDGVATTGMGDTEADS